MTPALPDSYRRPPLPQEQLRDEHGVVVEYGNRWGTDSPPEEAYGRISHLERFDPLVDVAGALVDHLVATYDVTVPDGASPLLSSSPVDRGDITGLVRLEPHSTQAAPLTIGFTRAGVLVRAGALYEAIVPGCACDACDISLAAAVGDLERVALAVPAGRFGEKAGRRWIEHAMTDEGWDAGRTRVSRSRRRQVRQARRRLRTVPAGWQPWPRR